MLEAAKGTVYYVSHLNAGTVSIIDGDNCQIIKEIKIGPRPYGIVADESDDLYIASDRNSKVTLIHDLYNYDKSWDMPNNGNIAVDSVHKKIYVCDTEEICIYNLKTGKKLQTIKGFTAADCIKLDKSKERLFVLDILQNELKIYGTSDFRLISCHKDIGIRPCSISIAEDGKDVYIANKGANEGSFIGGISILHLESKDVSHIDFPKGSIITELEISKKFLYAINSGLHQIDVIDISKKERVAKINTSLPEPMKIRLSHGQNILLVTNRNASGKGALDRIDINRNTVIDTLIFKRDNSMPYEIAIINREKTKTKGRSFISLDTSDTPYVKNATTILAKRILSTYQEKVLLDEVIVNVPSSMLNASKAVKVMFRQCKMHEGTENRKVLDNRKDYSIVHYDFYIPYSIEIESEDKQKFIIEEKLEGRQDATLFMPDCTEQREIQIVISSFTKLSSSPVIINSKIKFSASILISTKAVMEDVVCIPICGSCELRQSRGGYE